MKNSNSSTFILLVMVLILFYILVTMLQDIFGVSAQLIVPFYFS